ncbi:MAG: glycosyltransferase family 2 protein [Patescibacteria group bacterium]
MRKSKIDQSLPTLSIIIVTRNSEKKLPLALTSLEKQYYPKDKIEVIAVDGGSTDNTLSILKKSDFPIKVIQGKYPNNQEARRAVGLKYAKGEIVAYIDSDNYLPHKSWLKKMVAPFLQHPEIVGSFTLRYGYRKNDTLLNRYFALLGSADPVDHFLKKGERLSYLYDQWNRYGTIIAKDQDYIIVQFDPQFFPTLGANGFLARRKIWAKTRLGVANSVHVDVAYDLALMGYQSYAVVDDAIIHDTATSLVDFIQKRTKYILYYQLTAGSRKYRVFDPKRKDDVWNLLRFIFFSLTIVQPLIFAIRGYLKKRDLAWFIHPIYCFIITIVYSAALTYRFLKDQLIHEKV